jgi:hypothetical protein
MRIGLSLTIFAVAAAIGVAVVAGSHIVTSQDEHSKVGRIGSVTLSRPRSPVKVTDTAAQYWLQNGFSNLVLELPGDDIAKSAGVPVQQWESLGAVDQHWRLQPVGDGDFMTITNVLSEKVLAIKDGSTADGAPVIQAEPGLDDNSQEWALEDAGEGQVWVVNRHSGKVLDVPGDDIDMKNGTPVQQWQRQERAKDQRWLVVRGN